MKCCNGNHDHDSNQGGQGHNHKNPLSHMWMMLLCCIAPLAAIFLLLRFGNSIPAARNIMLTIVPFLCPVLMLLMMLPMMLPMMLNWKKEKQVEHNQCEAKQVQD